MSVIEKSQKLLTPKVKGPAKKFTFTNTMPKSTKNSDLGSSKKSFTFGTNSKKYADVKSKINSNVDHAQSM